MSPAAAAGIIALASLLVIAIAFMVHVDRKNEPVRRRDLKRAEDETARVRAALQKIEDRALENPDGFVLNTDILRITRSM